MKLTIVVQGYKGSDRVSASEAGAFLVKGVLIDGQEITASAVMLNCTPGELLMFTLRDAQPIGSDWTEEQFGLLWEVSDGLAGSPFEIEFREAPQ